MHDIERTFDRQDLFETLGDRVAELCGGLSDTFDQVVSPGRVGPAIECLAEDRHLDVCQEPRGRSVGTPLTQSRPDGGGDSGELRMRALLQLRAGGDDVTALLRVLSHSVGEHCGNAGESLDECAVRREVGVGTSYGLGQRTRQLIGAGEQHVALVGEVTGEGTPRQAGTVRDLRDGHVLESVLEKELDRGGTKALLALGIPSRHAPTLALMSQWDIAVIP